ncbi:MAG TPA: murein biosynthesis integral membrane protein MurJ, partial [Opitutaceae bacterium]|nr:murein biosynthesis integral membrane protein MurJ [Opitutaceae bacterium]
PGMEFGDLWRTVGKVVAAMLVMSFLVGGGWRVLQGSGLGHRAADIAAVGGLIPLGVAVYGVALWLFRIEGREEFVELSRKFLSKFEST